MSIHIPEGLNKEQKLMAEEILDTNPGAKILPTRPEPKELPGISEMEPIFHKTCRHVAFYYTHRPERGEMMTAVRARDIDGKRLEKGAPMECGSCGCHIESPSHLQLRKLQ